MTFKWYVNVAKNNTCDFNDNMQRHRWLEKKNSINMKSVYKNLVSLSPYHIPSTFLRLTLISLAVFCFFDESKISNLSFNFNIFKSLQFSGWLIILTSFWIRNHEKSYPLKSYSAALTTKEWLTLGSNKASQRSCNCSLEQSLRLT